ncbi:unnamed protein product [Pylaiella littoralis]
MSLRATIVFVIVLVVVYIVRSSGTPNPNNRLGLNLNLNLKKMVKKITKPILSLPKPKTKAVAKPKNTKRPSVSANPKDDGGESVCDWVARRKREKRR